MNTDIKTPDGDIMAPVFPGTIIGKRIAQGRKSKNLTQSAFADLLYVTPQCVSKWERNESLPDIFMLAKIGDIIGTNDICYFLGKEPCGCKVCDCCRILKN